MFVWPHTGEVQKVYTSSKFDRFRSTFTRDVENEVSTNLVSYQSAYLYTL